MKISMFFKSQLMCVMSLIFATLFAKADHQPPKVPCINMSDFDRMVCVGEAGWFRWRDNRYFFGTVTAVESIPKRSDFLVKVKNVWTAKGEYLPEKLKLPKPNDLVSVSRSDSYFEFGPSRNMLDLKKPCIDLKTNNQETVKICVGDCVYGYRWKMTENQDQCGNSNTIAYKAHETLPAKVLAIKKKKTKVYEKVYEKYYVLLDFGNYSFFETEIIPDQDKSWLNEFDTIFPLNPDDLKSCPTSF